VLNSHSIVLRLQNLAEFTELSFDLFKDGKLVLPDFRLNLPYKDIKESFHNGVPLGERYNWTSLNDLQVVDIHKNTVVGGKVLLKPLQIRSFRVDFTTDIPPPPKPTPFGQQVNIAGVDLSTLQKVEVKHLRCF